MVYCSNCGKKIDDKSKFCDECGKNIGEKTDADFSKNFEDRTNKAAKKFEENAERFGKQMERFGKRIEKRFDRSTKRFENWHDQYFGIFGPIIWSFLGLIIFRIVIELMALNPIDFPVWAKASELLYPYQLLFFGLMLLSSYTNYFRRKYHLFKLISPIPSTIGFCVTIWVLSTVYNDLFDSFNNFPDFTLLSNFVINNIAIIFVVILILAYLVNISILFSNQEKTKDDSEN